MKTVVICSGGLDSVTLAQWVQSEHQLTRLISFDYGQRHKTELNYARRCAERLHVEYAQIDISAVGAALPGSALTDQVDVPDGHYAENSMKITVVPNRNVIMLSIAFGIAAALKAEAVAIAVHGGDHFIYPDCRPEFIASFEMMQKHALDGIANIKLLAPFVVLNKAEIVAAGQDLAVPFAQTWSCYQGRKLHCGRCGTCVERQEAFYVAQIPDPTDYEDADYWRSVSKIKGLST